MSEVKCQIGAEVRLFNTDLVGMIDTETNCIIIRQPKAGFDAPNISMEDFIKQLETTASSGGLKIEVWDYFPEPIKKIGKKFEVTINEIYLKVITGNGISCEFAIWLSMGAKELKDLFPAFAITKGYLKLWSTSDPDILEEMQISQIEKMFDKAKAALVTEQPGENESKLSTKDKKKELSD